MTYALLQPNAPTLSATDKALITAFVRNEMYPEYFVEEQGIDLADFLLWLDQPHIQRAIASYESAIAFRQRRKDEHLRGITLYHLEKALEHASGPIETRRVAAQIYRFLHPARASAPRGAGVPPAERRPILPTPSANTNTPPAQANHFTDAEALQS